MLVANFRLKGRRVEISFKDKVLQRLAKPVSSARDTKEFCARTFGPGFGLTQCGVVGVMY